MESRKMTTENHAAAVIAHTAYRPAVAAPGTAHVAYPGDKALLGRLLTVLRPRTYLEIFLGFYSDRAARLALIVSSLILAYGGGAIMFWFHAIYLQEGGPAISNTTHWLLDSTVGFIGLTPAIALMLPVTAWIATDPAQPFRVRPAWYAIVGGTMFAFITAPGPLLHNALVGRGTWIADQATAAWGTGQVPVGTPRHFPPLQDMTMQVLAGLPTYIPLMLLCLLVVRGMTRLAALPAGRSA
jgi:hypothetical protein